MENILENKLYIGNLDYETVEADLEAYFSKCGTAIETLIIKDRDTGRSRGFGFVTMSTPEEAKKVIDELNDQELKGRNLIIRKARPRAQ